MFEKNTKVYPEILFFLLALYFQLQCLHCQVQEYFTGGQAGERQEELRANLL